MRHIQHKQSGFTLVEIAIVLVIIGLLLGGVLKGQEMITNARVKSVINDMKSVPTAYYAYMDRYRTVPGDDTQANTRFTDPLGAGNGASIAIGNGDGFISGLFTATEFAGGESANFWQHTRLAGFMAGSTVNGNLFGLNSVGGVLGIQSQVSAAGGTTYGMTGPVVCAGSVPWKVAQSVDTQLDNGASASGNLRAGAMGVAATVAATAPAYGPGIFPSAAAEAGLHTICMQI